MDKSGYEELQESFEELQRRYDELRIVVVKAGIPLPPEERKRPALTLIKGGLAAIVGLLGWLLLRAKQYKTMTIPATLTVCALTAGIVAWPALGPTPARGPQTARAATSPHRNRRRPVTRPRVAPRPPKKHGAPPRGGGVTVIHSTVPTVVVPLPQSSPQPSPTPSPSPSPEPPHPHPRPTPTHTRHCLAYIVILGHRICVKFGLGP